jgi:CheY-like chemotaxis protein
VAAFVQNSRSDHHEVVHVPFGHTNLPDVVLIDWQLRGESGRMMIEHLLTFPQELHPAILVSSGDLSLKDQTWLEGIPGLMFIWKPVSLRDLQELVRKTLARRHNYGQNGTMEIDNLAN